MKTITSIIGFLLFYTSSSFAQQTEVSLNEIYKIKEIANEVQKIPLLKKFVKSHSSDTIGIEFSVNNGPKGMEWARYTNVTLNGNGGMEEPEKFSNHEVFRLQPFGPEADDEWEDYLYIIRVKTGQESASAIIHLKFRFVFPKSVGANSPKVAEWKVDSQRTIIK